MTKLTNLDQLKSWAKQNAFIYPSSEIYGGFAAVYDYGPNGVLLMNNIKNAWWKAMVQYRDDVVGLDSGIYMHPKTWVASGHASGFSDVLVEDKKNHERYRADHLIEEWFRKNKSEDVDMDKKTPAELDEIIKQNNIKSPDGNDLTSARSFNLLVKSNLGTTDASFNDENVTYLRGETCQGIYLEYKNIIDTTGIKLPFGIAQIGKAFRNELVARQFVFRTREFEQMEMQYFHHPTQTKELFEMWKQNRWDWYLNELGIDAENLKFKQHEKLVFYATQAFDIQYKFNTLGKFDEVEGIHARSDYDLTQHAKFSGVKLDYFDQEKNERFVPHIMETSVGVNRLLMMLLDNCWTEEELTNAKGEKDSRIVLKIKNELAPYRYAVLPLSKKPELSEISHKVVAMLKRTDMTAYDDRGSIGKRYRRQDEIGTPYCITVDFDSLDDQCVTIRERDSMQQKRVKIDELMANLK